MERIITDIKLKNNKYKVEILKFNKNEYYVIGYHPAPNTEIRHKIDNKISKWIYRS